jgi:predicted dienelactone hydrolase
VSRLRRVRPVGAALSVAAAVLVAACGGGNSAGDTGTAGPRFAEAGPYAAGVTTLSLGDRQVEVWYPADDGAADGKKRDVYHLRDWLPPNAQQALDDVVAEEGLPAKTADPSRETDAYRDIAASDDGPFPVVLFSHGVASYRSGSSFLTAHLASWGFIVAAPDFLERGIAAELGSPPATPLSEADVLRQTTGLMISESSRDGALLKGRVAPEGFAIVGHSAGGATAIRFGSEPGLITYVAMAAGIDPGPDAAPFEPGAPSSMWLAGAADGVIPLTNVQAGFNRATPPARLVVIAGGGHQTFSDLCTLGRAGSGIVAGAGRGEGGAGNLTELATDGCQDGAVLRKSAWPVINHYVTAQLRDAFGLDEDVGLDAATSRQFEGVGVTYTERD